MGTLANAAIGPSRALLARARSGDHFARDRVARQLMPMAEHVARRFAGPQHPVEDLTQVAGIGILKALERYDSKRDATFGTYAHALMTGEVRRYVRDSRMVRVPRPIYEQVPAFQRKLAALRSELGREPTRDELADALGVTKEDVIEIADAATSAQHISLDAAADETGGDLPLADHDREFARAEAGADLEPMLAALSPRERMVLDLRFQDGLSQSEIAQGLALSQTQVSRIIRQALAKLSQRAGVTA